MKSEIYGLTLITSSKPAIPDNVTEARVLSVNLNLFVDASHATNAVTRISHSGFIIFMERAPIIWHAHRQNTI